MKMSAFVRSMLALAAAVAIAAGAGSKTTSAAQGRTESATATVVFGPGSFEEAEENGVTGRNVRLAGAIEGTNFEPGVCQDGVDPVLGLHCVVLGDGPGMFTRLAPGGVSFTTCHCTVAGEGEPGDTVILKISYPPATPPQYPFNFTKFTFLHGTGELSGLSGQGTLDFATLQATFTYRFSGRQ
jgi:hypothetical protein